MIYFIECLAPDHRPIKIGYTANTRSLNKRLSALQVGCPWPLIVVALWSKGTAEQEARLQNVFAAHKLRGEWFVPVPALKRIMARYSPST